LNAEQGDYEFASAVTSMLALTPNRRALTPNPLFRLDGRGGFPRRRSSVSFSLWNEEKGRG